MTPKEIETILEEKLATDLMHSINGIRTAAKVIANESQKELWAFIDFCATKGYNIKGYDHIQREKIYSLFKQNQSL